MSDLISRQAVLDKFKSLCDACGEGDKYNGVMCRACALDDGICIVEDLPSAEPERTAKVKEGWGLAMCCACKKRVFPCDRYCSHCGARLEWNE